MHNGSSRGAMGIGDSMNGAHLLRTRQCGQGATMDMGDIRDIDAVIFKNHKFRIHQALALTLSIIF